MNYQVRVRPTTEPFLCFRKPSLLLIQNEESAPNWRWPGNRLYIHKDKPHASGMKKCTLRPTRNMPFVFTRIPMPVRFQPYCLFKYHRKMAYGFEWAGRPPSEIGDYYSQLCWPVAIIEKPSLGLTPPTAKTSFKSGKLKGKDKDNKWFSNQKLRKFLPPKELGDWYGYFHFVEWPELWPNCVTGLAHSDLSNNVLVDPLTGQCR